MLHLTREFDFKNNSFDFMRLFLALCVVLIHGFVIFFTHNGKVFFEPNWLVYKADIMRKGGTSDLGELAVLCFFVISGFLITRSAIGSIQKNDWVTFWKKRFFRIYPGYFVSLLLTCTFFVLITLIAQNNFSNPIQVFNESAAFFFRSLAVETPVYLIPSLSDVPINGSYWTLLQELRAYFLVFVFGVFGLLQKRIWVLILTILVNLAYVFGLYNADVRAWFDLVFYDFRFVALLLYFLVGAVFLLFLEKIRWNWLLFFFSCLGLGLGLYFNLVGIFWPVCLTYFLLFISQVLPFRNWSSKIGDWSYGIYIYSSPIQVFLLYTELGKGSFRYYFLLSLVLSLLAGYCSWHLVEKRFIRR
jgi:peptidoglycan/LPS O-acetylase OafA/YrhL